MEDRHEYKASLRVISSELGLSELIDALGERTASHDIGDPVSPASAPDGTRWRHAHWGLTADVARGEPLDKHVQRIVEYAESRKAQLDAIRPRCDRLDIFCGVFAHDAQGGWEFRPDLMGRLADLKLAVAFDLYPA